MKVYVVSKTNGKVELVDKVFTSQEDAQEYIDNQEEQQDAFICSTARAFERMNTQEVLNAIICTYGSIESFLKTLEPLTFRWSCTEFKVC